jgi:hypothetical protein
MRIGAGPRHPDRSQKDSSSDQEEVEVNPGKICEVEGLVMSG